MHTSDELAAYLLEKYQLATLPGSAFGTPESELALRLSSSYLDLETDEQAHALLRAYRANPDPARLMREHHPNLHRAVERFGDFIDSLG